VAARPAIRAVDLLHPEVLSALIFSLVPVIGVIFWNWSPFALLLLYWSENVVIGVRVLASMLTAGLVQGLGGAVGAIFISAFFLVHYGMFCTVHGVFVVTLFGDVQGRSSGNPYAVALTTFQDQHNLALGFGCIVALQLVEFILFVGRGEPRRAQLQELMGSPYPRVILLHVTLMFGGLLLLALGWPPIGVVFMAVLKLLRDVSAALRSVAQESPAAPLRV